jgi:ubiquinone/menaquinone biosynthesis C-methylase UbiE
MNMTEVPADDYVMGRTQHEYRRLDQQAEMWEPTTRRVLQQIGLGPGMSCLDIGCGTGAVMQLMAEMVGDGGHVTGVDVDADVGQYALHRVQETGSGQYRFIQADVETIDDADGQLYDVTYARLVLIHARNPRALLRKMYAWTKPGGYIVVQDFDLRAVDAYPWFGAWAEFQKVMYGVFVQAGRDVQIGHKLPYHFVASGLGQPDGTDVAGVLSSLEDLSSMYQTVYQSLLPRALELGLTTPKQAEEFFDTMNSLPRRHYHVASSPLLISAWKRKPEDCAGA